MTPPRFSHHRLIVRAAPRAEEYQVRDLALVPDEPVDGGIEPARVRRVAHSPLHLVPAAGRQCGAVLRAYSSTR